MVLLFNNIKINYVVINRRHTGLLYGNDKVFRHVTEIKQPNKTWFNLTDTVNWKRTFSSIGFQLKQITQLAQSQKIVQKCALQSITNTRMFTFQWTCRKSVSHGSGPTWKTFIVTESCDIINCWKLLYWWSIDGTPPGLKKYI